jgi:regulator of replication initiation timing
MGILDKMLGNMNFAELERQVAAFFRHAEQMTTQVNALRGEVSALRNENAELRGRVQSMQSALLRIEQCLTMPQPLPLKPAEPTTLTMPRQ